MYTENTFKADDRKRQTVAPARSSNHSQNPHQNNNMSRLQSESPQRSEQRTKRPRHSETHGAYSRGIATPKTNDDVEFIATTTPAPANYPTTFESCFVFLNESLTSIEKSQMAAIAAARKHLKKCLEEHAEVATAKAKLAHLSLHPERCYGIPPSDLLDSIVQSISEGGAIQIATVAGDTALQCGQTVSPPAMRRNEDTQSNSMLVRRNDSFLTQAPTTGAGVGNGNVNHRIHQV